MLDSLGSQKYTEQQIIYMRKVKNLEHDLDALEDRRKALESATSLSELEAGKGKLQASDSEAVRMSDYAGAIQASQTRVAQGTAEHAVKQALIENDRDRKLMEAELESNRRLSELDQKFTTSIQNAHSEPDKARLRSELEIEKAKAEAQRKKAMIEANSALDLSQLEQRYQSKIFDAKSSVSAVNQVASQESQKQRIKVVLANADSQRRVKDDITEIQNSVASLQAERQSSTQAIRDEITKLSMQLAALQSQEKSVEAGYDTKIALAQSRLTGLQGQSQQLAEMERNLIDAPIISGNQSSNGVESREVQRLEVEAQRARSDLLVQKANRLAEVDQQLSHDLDMLSARLSADITAPQSPGSTSIATIEKTASESAIRNELASKRTQINNDARSELAELIVKTEIAKAGVVAPVVTSRAVYSGSYGDKPEAFVARESNTAREMVARAKAEVQPVAIAKRVANPAPIKTDERLGEAPPLLVASTFEPRPVRSGLSQVEDVVIAKGVMAGGDLKPLVIAPSTTTYTVVYSYSEKGTAEKFMAYLRAYGIDDFTYRYSEKLGKHILLMGKFTSKEQAAGRVAFLNRTTSTANAAIIETDI
jgi:hypothetical protein